MASSIHIENSSASALIHNERLFSIDHAIDSDERNEFIAYENTASKGREARFDYENFHQKKMPSNATIIKEGLINLEERHTLKDLEPVKKTLENMGYCVTHISVHKDEGHINPDGSKEYNYHAHVMIINYDFEKHRTVRPTHKQMRELQTDVAKALDMQRGLEYINPKSAHPEQIVRYQKNPELFTTEKKQRLKTWDYKKAMELKENATKELTQEIKAKDYSLKEMQSRIVGLEGANTELRKELHAQNREINKTQDLEAKEQKITELEAKLTEIEGKNTDLSKSLEASRSIRVDDKKKISELSQTVDDLKTDILEISTKNLAEPVHEPINVQLQNENKMLKVINQGLEIELKEAKSATVPNRAAVEIPQGDTEPLKVLKDDSEKWDRIVSNPDYSKKENFEDLEAFVKKDRDPKKVAIAIYNSHIVPDTGVMGKFGGEKKDDKLLMDNMAKEIGRLQNMLKSSVEMLKSAEVTRSKLTNSLKTVVENTKTTLQAFFRPKERDLSPEVKKERTEPNLSNSDKMRGFIDQIKGNEPTKGVDRSGR